MVWELEDPGPDIDMAPPPGLFPSDIEVPGPEIDMAPPPVLLESS